MQMREEVDVQKKLEQYAPMPKNPDYEDINTE